MCHKAVKCPWLIRYQLYVQSTRSVTVIDFLL